MSIRNHAAAVAILALGVSVAPCASAALWSSTNTVAGISEMATMEISLTGDQVTVATQVDVVIPAGITILSFTPLNGGSCNYISSIRTVRVLVDDPMLRPLPTWARPACSIQYRVSRAAGAWFPMRNAICARADATALPSSLCPVDEGYLTVRL
jgi:hypothetical protein